MTILVVGASGATGRLVVNELLGRNHKVRIVVRTPENLPESIRSHENIEVIQAAILDLSMKELAQYVEGCAAVASCLGHNVSFKGIYLPPRKLVTEAARRICKAIISNNPAKPVKYILMNTAGNSNRDLDEKVSLGHKLIIILLRLLLPPHPDNEKAADFLRTHIGQNHLHVQWAAVRPDNLVNEDNTSDYEVHPSPIRSAIFDPGTTSRINVGHFMAELIENEDTWNKWKGQMPVIYNKSGD